ncbi:hypothetical protein SMICM17S_04779 [Streptomyces microflavus]
MSSPAGPGRSSARSPCSTTGSASPGPARPACCGCPRTDNPPPPRPASPGTVVGDCLWSTPIALGAVAHPGVLGMGADTGWEDALWAWVPDEVDVDHGEPLRPRRQRRGESPRRGRERSTFFLDLDGGAIVSATSPAPTGRKAIAGPGEFLIGSQGYGEFTTRRYDRDCSETSRWASHGAMLATAEAPYAAPSWRTACRRRRGSGNWPGQHPRGRLPGRRYYMSELVDGPGGHNSVLAQRQAPRRRRGPDAARVVRDG